MLITYPESLPITSIRKEFLHSLDNNQIVIVAGETGSGKTTQLPKMCLEYLGHNSGTIGCTQPRRIAATSVSEQVKRELGSHSDIVAYKIRFRDTTSSSTKIKFMTDGVLLAETQRDPKLSAYDVLIIDEAHERSLNIDFILGYLNTLVLQRKDLKIVITSATIDTQAFSTFFSNAPIINVEGKSFPIEVVYTPFDDEDVEEVSYLDKCVDQIITVTKNYPPGDILVFLPTEKDIRQCVEMLSPIKSTTEVLPMFGRLQGGDQNKIFKSFHKTKIVVSTNVAETSITVPGIRYVIDSGLARISQYNPRAKTTGLPIQRISKASCDQRKGRCGRVGPGTCFRLYSEENYHSRSQYSVPEIKRANLADVILRMASLKLPSPNMFPFLEPPHSSAIRDGEKLLIELGAITATKEMTRYGKIMSTLPIDPCISRMIIEASKNSCLKETLIIAAALAIQDPKVRPADKENEADLAHSKFKHPHSEFMALLTMWQSFFEENGTQLSWSKIKKFCKISYLSFQRVREWLDLHDQLHRIVKKITNFQINNNDADYESIHKSLSAGLLRNIARKTTKNQYVGAGQKELTIFPGSFLYGKGGKWLIAANFIETNRLYCLSVANIEPEWLEITAKHLCSYSYSNPRWEKKNGQVIADESVSLFGLPIVSQRKAVFGKLSKHRNDAQDIFIANGLLQDQLKGDYAFLNNNINLVKKWENSENKIRKKDLIVDLNTLHIFYKSRLPETVYNQPSLNKYLKKSGPATHLFMNEQDIISRELNKSEKFDFPDFIEVGETQLSLTYCFDPTSFVDGMTITMPFSLASSFRPAIFDWLVPGLRKEKVLYLLKNLPKRLRKQLVPLNRTLDILLDEIAVNQQGEIFLNCLEKAIHKRFEVQTSRTDWPTDLPTHLVPHFNLIDHKGKTLCKGSDLQNLCNQGAAGKETIEKGSPSKDDEILLRKLQGTFFSTWDFAKIPSTIILYNSFKQISGFLYPYIKPLTDKGGVKLFFTDEKSLAEINNNSGMRLLYRSHFSAPYTSLKKYCQNGLSAPSCTIFFKGYPSKQKVVECLLHFILTSIFSCNSGLIHTEKQYKENIQRVKSAVFYQQATILLDLVFSVIREWLELSTTFGNFMKLEKKQKSFSQLRNDLFQAEISSLLPYDFLSHTTQNYLELKKREIQSMQIRIQRAHANPLKDQTKVNDFKKYQDNLQQIEKKLSTYSDTELELVVRYKRLVSEYKIALFSPEIKPSCKVSTKILANAWKNIHHPN